MGQRGLQQSRGVKGCGQCDLTIWGVSWHFRDEKHTSRLCREECSHTLEQGAHRLGESSPGMCGFQRDGPQVLEKTALGGKRCTFQRDRERIYTRRLSEVTPPKRRFRAHLPVTRCWLERTVSSPGGRELS